VGKDVLDMPHNRIAILTSMIEAFRKCALHKEDTMVAVHCNAVGRSETKMDEEYSGDVRRSLANGART
jgi:hypothetical protein